MPFPGRAWKVSRPPGEFHSATFLRKLRTYLPPSKRLRGRFCSRSRPPFFPRDPRDSAVELKRRYLVNWRYTSARHGETLEFDSVHLFPSVYSRRRDLSFSERSERKAIEPRRVWLFSEFIALRGNPLLCVCVYVFRLKDRETFLFFPVSSTDYLALSLQFCLKFQVSFAYFTDRTEKEEFSSIELSPTSWNIKVVSVRRFFLKFSITTFK